MKRTSLFLDEQLQLQLQRLARRRGVSFATVVREALAVYVASPGAPDHTPSVPTIAGRFSSGHRDTASQVDELLWRDPHG